MTWTRAVREERLEDGRAAVVRIGPRPVALLRREGRIFAFDNRCPHEGYPLSEGRVDERCVLTCEWHNWKFDLSDGRNLYGTDHLGVHPTRLREGWVEVDLAERSAVEVRRSGLASLRAAFDDRQHDRIARVVARLHFEGIDPVLAVEQAILWSHDRFEYGMTHAWAAAADWLSLHDESPEDLPARLAAVVEAVDHTAHDSLRQPRFPFPAGRLPFDEPAFQAAIEKQDEEAALARLEGALAAGLDVAALEGPLARAALAHYRDYGHSLIWVQKAGALIRRLGTGVEGPILRGLVRSLVHSTREDLIPAFRGYAPRLAAFPGFPSGTAAPAPPASAPAGLGVNRAMDWVVASAAAFPPEGILDRLVEAAGAHLLRYDTRFGERADLSVNRSFGWLDLTHAVTFAAALRELAERHPEAWAPGLLQLACFTGRAAPFLQPERPAPVEEDPERFWQAARSRVFDHGHREPIYACHLLKTALAARELAGRVTPRSRDALLAGTRRFLESPLKQKHVERTVRQAVQLVGLDYAGTSPR